DYAIDLQRLELMIGLEFSNVDFCLLVVASIHFLLDGVAQVLDKQRLQILDPTVGTFVAWAQRRLLRLDRRLEIRLWLALSHEHKALCDFTALYFRRSIVRIETLGRHMEWMRSRR